jgi:hypothetical protein
MTRSVDTSRKVRDDLAGHNIAAAIPIPELVSLEAVDVRMRFHSLENETQRRSFLDGIISKLGSNLGNWAAFYEAVEIVREHDAYWRGKGYRSFDEFWKAAAGPCFRSFKELEDIYNFAKTACPEMFQLDFEAARIWAQQVHDLRAVPALDGHGGVRIKKRHYEDNDEAHAAVVQASKWYNAGGNSLEYRLAKIKRHRPDIAAAVLAGDYFRVLASGRIGIDMVAAERDAYGENARVRKQRRSSVHAAVKVAGAIRALAESSTERQLLVNELSNIDWLVNALLKVARERGRVE